MKPFDLEAAKRGEPIQTLDGKPVEFIGCATDENVKYAVAAHIEGTNWVATFSRDGSILGAIEDRHYSLCMAPKTIRAHIVIARYPDGDRIYDVCENATDAKNQADYYNAKGAAYVSIRPFEFEE